MAVKIATRSRLHFAELALVKGVEAWDIPLIPSLDPAPDDVQYQVDELDTIELLAYRFYQDQAKWWIIAYRNQMFDLPGDLVPGMFIVIPSPRRALDDLFQRQLIG